MKPQANSTPHRITIEAPPVLAAELRRLLRSGGLESACREGGGEAPDCVLVAHEPPEADALARLARRGGPDGLPGAAVIVVTAGVDLGLRRAALRAGAMEVLDRERLAPEALSAAIRDAIDRFSARREAEAALRRSEEAARQGERFAQRVINKLFAFVGVLDTSGTLLQANEAPLAAAGIGIEDVRRKKFWDCYWWSYSDEVRQQLRAACERAARGEVVRYDVIVRMAGDSRMAIDFQVAPLHDDAGQITHLIPSAVDITERKRMELELRRSEELVRTIAENSTQGFAMMDERGYCTYANRAWLEMTGYSREEIGAAPLHDLVHHHYPDGRPYPMSECPIDRALPENFEIRSHEDLFFRKDGGAFPVLCAASPIFKDGRPVSTVIEVRDATAAKRAQAELREREQHLSMMVEHSPFPAMVHAEDGQVLKVNAAFTRLSGYSHRDIPTIEAWLERAYGERAPDARRRMDALYGLGEMRAEGEHEIRTADGQARVWSFFSGPLGRAPDGRRLVLSTAADITERRRVEEALREADRRKDEFIAILAHELRNPLTPVRNAVEILRRVGPAEPRLQRARDIIDRQVAHMARLIDDLLDVSRIARGKLALQKETCDLAAIVRQTAEDYRVSLEAAGLSLVVPGAAGPIWVDGDPVRLAQMVGNLLHNAKRFTEKGGRVEVRVGLDMASKAALVSIVDTGVGMDAGLLSRLFDPFSQADQDLARSKGGLGLGLALTKGLAELHGGGVAAQSDGLGRGSTFTLRLPLSKARYDAAPQDGQGRGGGGGLRVLVVEDNRDAAETLGELLELGGHEVKLAFNGAAALAVAAEFLPDVVISDIGLPGDLDGYAVARALRAEPALAGARLISISGYASEEARRRSREAGFAAHLAKPPDLAALERLLRAAASSSSSAPGG
jgi:PAS domain S-box-containing protein